MAQQVFDQYVSLAKVSANETIPVVAAIAQTRDGKDELLHGTVPFVPAGDLYVPVSAANRLPVEATLTGRIVEEVLLPRGVRTTSERIRVDIPTGARYVVINGYVYGRTGTFADGEGFRVTALVQGFYSVHVHHGVGAQTKYSYTSQQIHLLGLGPEVSRPSSDVVMNPSERWAQYVAEAVPLVGRLHVEVGISGTFGEGEGIDSEVRITWYM